MALHAEISATLDMPVHFCDKASPWQRPSNENTNGLLRQYSPKGSDLRTHSPDELAAVAAELELGTALVLGQVEITIVGCPGTGPAGYPGRRPASAG